MKIAFIGIGNVGFAIANNLHKIGYEIIIANNNIQSDSVKNAVAKNPNFQVLKIQDAVDIAEIIFLATPFNLIRTALENIKFNEKVLVDCTNPVGPGISHGLKSVQSGSETVQELVPDANVVKAFSIYGYENFIDNKYPKYDIKPVMLICGNNKEAKLQLSKLIEDLGYYPKDTGNLSQALHLEHLTLLWIKMVRLNGHTPNFVWGYLER